MRRRLSLWVLVVSSVGCSRADAQPRPAAAGPPSVALPAPSAKAAVQEAPPAELAWVEALRRGRFAEAARALDALGDELERTPELRFARARAALELGEHARAASLLADLEKKLPSVAAHIERLRAEAELEAGPHARAAAYFVKAGGADSLARAALGYERAGDRDRAMALASRVVGELKGKRRRDTESLARAVRARLAERAGNKAQAAVDWRWLALENPTAVLDADQRLEKLDPKRALTKEERLARAQSFGRSGKLKEANAELDRIASAPGQAVNRARIERARAFALYNARADYLKASELFTSAARGPGVEPAECTFYAARSLARAHRDDEALAAYRALAKRYARSSFAEQAAYLIARTLYSGGRFAEAATAYDAYLKKYGRGRNAATARYERAVSLLALGKHTAAAKALRELAAGEKDSRRSARLLHLEGVALQGAGDEARAVERFQEVAREQPLGFAALASAARLEKLGRARPPLLPAAALGDAAVPAELVVELPEAVQLLRRLGLDAEAEEELRGHERALKTRYAPRSNEALCQAYSLLETAARRYQVGQYGVDGRVLGIEPTALTRWQWDCVYPRPYSQAVNEVSQAFGVPEALLYGVMRQESAFKPGAVSGAGANGLMQVIVPTARRVSAELGEPLELDELDDPGPNLRLGASYLKKLLDTFGGNVALAAGAYNAGPVAMRRWMKGAAELPLDVFVARIPYRETLNYVERVVGNYARYRYLEGGPSAVPKLALELPEPPPASAELY